MSENAYERHRREFLEHRQTPDAVAAREAVKKGEPSARISMPELTPEQEKRIAAKPKGQPWTPPPDIEGIYQ